ncbi:MAG: XRE family transcriptional regulator [Gemmatimonadaceae bacterium]|nr:XRE family transcriptional regulator [Gemmatimonadaceae bacterium]
MTMEPTNMPPRPKSTARRNDGVALIDKLFGDEPGWADAVARAELECNVAEEIFALRERHGLTQKTLAARARTTQSVVARLEDAEYTGHSLRMLVRIATAVGERVDVSFVANAASRRNASAQAVTSAAKATSTRQKRQARVPR